ncbi:hypothetical protein MJO28_011289 [Puccinia striiformis f. sp. tritici]|uniref:Uncharacterized protein n=3 Tax=Puccinia striiformis TaxID=27350 RepID=A0A0L0W5B7_9BASI|nr:hypothetical protein Pst134EA_020977 [Puccinia striiformis f. sp. tritici]KAI9621687.1 hypothetical protein KEM48_007616 [Puccinia striiformis f. sp. tritici PST-130]KNF06719.1 hypothetical protein PSTG_00035 [Puccinia striiformis f. sp. tritici PST-78]POW20439.1 hypothetical protein PSHT_03474 [Puccinia striiformis]KAH9447754.1 hypothetical protein Pst134EB_021756 [Puccinia striiformis f. sp. tritici]KAH9457079.1 hypothetical protein Pst134EA_020977 [Puccinia striiformis f. sp. tritici]
MLPTNQSIRLIALPLSKQSKSLIYFYAQPPPPQTTSDVPKPAQLRSPSFLIKKLTDTGTKQWIKLADSKQGSLKLKIYNFGERMMDKIPFEEWALKTIEPPISSSSSTEIDKPENQTNMKSEIGSTTTRETRTSSQIELLYPGSLCIEQELISGLKRRMEESEPYHQKWMKLNLFLSPLTIPCAIIPLIPNLPFFYMMWRSWSHWRAFKASRYLNVMIRTGRVKPIKSPILDSLYSQVQKNLQAGKVQQPQENGVILSHEILTKLQKQLDLPLESITEISRGIHQAQQRLEADLTTTNNTHSDSSKSSP